ncbi:MAG TPA: nucleoside 2-deoxyribosyltransferase [Rhodopseudomonas sp.]|uniref:nucleoside 2-deoxyribosyltransferase n=1 Tax=Rhodopseudomonas sp. TaxID=1078 RepID=UPI002ED88244
MLIYLAGPDVFLPDAVEIGRRKQAICARHGLIGLYPLDAEFDAAAPGLSRAIFRSNEAMMSKAQAIIANLTPFRGPSADAGTVYELGFMAGCGKLCLGYCNDPLPYTQRVAARGEVTARDGVLHDAHGHVVEDFGLADNLMIAHALDLHGCALITPQSSPDDPWHDLAAFEACVKLAAARLPPAKLLR